jgi:hypothetical protein
MLLVIALLLCVLNYARRGDYEEFIMREGLGILLTAVAPVILLGILALAAFAIFTLVYAFRKGGHPLPIIVLIVGGILSETAPLPPSPAATTFYQYRPDYETVVELARQRQLGHEGYCQYAFSVPDTYRYLTRECVFVETEHGLAVSFAPTTSQLVIAYAESVAALHTLMDCDGRHGAVSDRLESNWYLCIPAQD